MTTTRPRSAATRKQAPPTAYQTRIVGPDGHELVPGTPEAEALTLGVTAWWAQAIAAERDGVQAEVGQ